MCFVRFYGAFSSYARSTTLETHISRGGTERSKSIEKEKKGFRFMVCQRIVNMSSKFLFFFPNKIILIMPHKKVCSDHEKEENQRTPSCSVQCWKGFDTTSLHK